MMIFTRIETRNIEALMLSVQLLCVFLSCALGQSSLTYHALLLTS